MLVLDKSVNLKEYKINSEKETFMGTHLVVDEKNHIYISCDDSYYDIEINECLEQLIKLFKDGKITIDDKKMWEELE